MPLKIDGKALEAASKKLRRLRLTDVGGRKEQPCETLKSVLQRGLGGLYSDAAVEYILKFGVKYYLEAREAECEEVDHGTV
ncbi:hypothetical protein [Pseudovibrio sp. POLY-S9]|uniref:hypothetical protein n=1 Tax=Pseudovibrio sp. POLY-S9 TaxID=1576596 RepID=UPI00070AB4F4|nr:hypothetical protein [Pseudovibrio sp. POLY-S9]